MPLHSAPLVAQTTIAIGNVHTVHVDPPLRVGTVPLGERRVITITGDHFTQWFGLAIGALQWLALLEATWPLCTDDGALLYVTNVDIRRHPQGVLGSVDISILQG